MAYDAYLWFEGGKVKVEGETQDDEFKAKKAVEVDSFSFGAYNQVTIGSQSGGGGAGKADFTPVGIGKRTDKATMGLFECCAVGDHIDTATLALRRAGGSASKSGAIFLQFNFKFVMVSSINWNGGAGQELCTESVELQYGAIKIEYWGQDPTGKDSKVGEKMWSRVLNKAVFAVA
jgi:type VI secretion system secreted protein Hcp